MAKSYLSSLSLLANLSNNPSNYIQTVSSCPPALRSSSMPTWSTETRSTGPIQRSLIPTVSSHNRLSVVIPTPSFLSLLAAVIALVRELFSSSLRSDNDTNLLVILFYLHTLHYVNIKTHICVIGEYDLTRIDYIRK